MRWPWRWPWHESVEHQTPVSPRDPAVEAIDDDVVRRARQRRRVRDITAVEARIRQWSDAIDLLQGPARRDGPP